MHKRFKDRKFGREIGSRRAVLRSLATAVILYEKINTTKAKAKEVQRIIERLITYAKRGSLEGIRRLNSYLLEKNAAKKMMQELASLYQNRNGGYTRVVNIGFRKGDNAPMARIELLDTEKLLKKVENKDTKTEEEQEKDKLKGQTIKTKAVTPK